MDTMLQEIQADAPRESSEARAVFYTERAYGMARGAVACSWLGGRALNEVKEKLAHGEFRPWLESVSIAPETARRWMRVAEAYSLDELLDVGTVAKALKLLEDPALRVKEAALEGYDVATDTGVELLRHLWKTGEVLRKLDAAGGLEPALAKLKLSAGDGANLMASAAVPMDEYCTPENAVAYADRLIDAIEAN